MRALCLLFSLLLGVALTFAVDGPQTTRPTTPLASTTTEIIFSTARYNSNSTTTSFPSNCPNDFSSGPDGICYSTIYFGGARNSAYNKCAKSGTFLYYIISAAQNNRVRDQAANFSTSLWLGLTCTRNGDISSCAWDNNPSRTLSIFDYSNFGTGQPNIYTGPCVYMNTSDGMWYSAPCFTTISNYACQFIPSVAAQTCHPTQNAEPSYFFRGKCYWSTIVNGYAYAQKSCSNNCGRIVSIHSPGENNYISVIAYNDRFNYAYIGLSYVNNNYTWDDGSSYDYSNFGYENTLWGNCVTMASVQDLVPAGQWINVDCEQYLPAVCEKDPQNMCDTTTSPAPTRAPATCVSPQSFSQSGYIYSPGYPNGMDSTSCEYVITVNQNETAEIYFPTINIYAGSKLIFYSDIYSKNPFKTLAYKYNTTEKVISPTNIIRMYFNSTYNDGSYWYANYGSAPVITTTPKPTTTSPPYPKCTSASDYFYQNGTIYSPGYPRAYYQADSCTYRITENNGLNAQIYFSYISLGYFSKLAFYSDNNPGSSPFQVLNSQYSSILIISPTNYIKMVYNTTGDGSTWIANYGTTRKCDATYYYSGAITSTNYPSPYPSAANRNCTYTLSSLSYSSKTCIIFDDINLHSSDNIRVFDGTIYGRQIALYTAYTYSPTEPICTNSTTSTLMTVVFEVQANNGVYPARGFRARFDDSIDHLTAPTPNTYCGNTYYGSGSIYSQNYPAAYPLDNQNCSYTLNSQRTKTCIKFGTFNLRNYDYVTLYDGLGSWGKQIARLYSVDLANKIYCSFSLELTVVFTTFKNSVSVANIPAFSAQYGPDSNSLQPIASESNRSWNLFVISATLFCVLLG